MTPLEIELTAALERAVDHLIMDIGRDGKGIHSTDTPQALAQARTAIRKSRDAWADAQNAKFAVRDAADWQAEARAKAARMEAEEAALPLQIVKTETGWGVAKILGESALDYEILCETKTIEQATAAAARIESEHGRALSSTQGSREAVTELQRRCTVKPDLSNRATFERTQIEVGTGSGYRWATAFFVIKPTGEKLFPPMIRKEAIAFCKAQGWDHSAIVNGPA